MITREQLIKNLNEDLAREYQAIIAYVVYSQATQGRGVHEHCQGARGVHAAEELAHALDHLKQIDCLGGDQAVVPKPVKTSSKAQESASVRPWKTRLRPSRQYRGAGTPVRSAGRVRHGGTHREIRSREQEHQIEPGNRPGEGPTRQQRVKPVIFRASRPVSLAFMLTPSSARSTLKPEVRLSAFKPQQRRLTIKGHAFHFVSYEGALGGTSAAVRRPNPSMWYLMRWRAGAAHRSMPI